MLSVNELAEMSVKELDHLSGNIKLATIIARQREADALRAKIESATRTAGYTVREVLFAKGARRPRPIAAKYVNPSRPTQTWTGRGRRPTWLAAKLAAGAPLNRFLSQ
jgi:DNA-binding protein H-NS